MLEYSTVLLLITQYSRRTRATLFVSGASCFRGDASRRCFAENAFVLRGLIRYIGTAFPIYLINPRRNKTHSNGFCSSEGIYVFSFIVLLLYAIFIIPFHFTAEISRVWRQLSLFFKFNTNSRLNDSSE